MHAVIKEFLQVLRLSICIPNPAMAAENHSTTVSNRRPRSDILRFGFLRPKANIRPLHRRLASREVRQQGRRRGQQLNKCSAGSGCSLEHGFYRASRGEVCRKLVLVMLREVTGCMSL